MLGVALLSGGIDSPVALHLMAKKGFTLVPLHFASGGSEKRVQKIVSILQRAHDGVMDLVAVDQVPAMQAYSERCNPKYACLFCKRMMVRAASKLGEQEGAGYILTGDSLAQVASQTLENIVVVEAAASLPVVRPLIGMDKMDTVKISREAGLYDVSSASSPPCPFLPGQVSTKATAEALEAEEEKLDIGALVDAYFQ